MDHMPSASMTPTVSVIIPAHNAAATVGETIESILQQTWADLEVIVVDDGSTDSTASVVNGISQRDPRVRHVAQENARQSAARNRGLTESRGIYIAAIDADDLWVPTKLERQLALIRSTDDLIVLTGIRRFCTDRAGERRWLHESMPPDVAGRGVGLDHLIALRGDQMVLMNTALFRREHLVQLGGWNTAIWSAEDWELWLRAAKSYRFASIPEALHLYRKHETSLTKQQDLRRVLSLHIEIIKQFDGPGVSARVKRDAITSAYLRCIGSLRYGGQIIPAFSCWIQAGLAAGAWRHLQYWSELAEIGQAIVRRRAQLPS